MRKHGKHTERREFYALVNTLIDNTVMSNSSIPLRAFQDTAFRHVFNESSAQALCKMMEDYMSARAGTVEEYVPVSSIYALRSKWLENTCPDKKLTTHQWQALISKYAERCAEDIARQLGTLATCRDAQEITKASTNGYNMVPFTSHSSALNLVAEGQAGERQNEILAHVISESLSLSGVIKDTSDYTVHRPPSETSFRHMDPGNGMALENEQKEKRGGKVTKVNDRTNDPRATDDIKLVEKFDVEDELTGQAPFEDNKAAPRTGVKDDFIFRGDGKTRQTSDQAVWFDGLFTRSLKSVSGPEIQQESRQFLLKSVLPKLTKQQGQDLAKAFMHSDEGGIERILELVKRSLPYMTLRKSA